MSNLYYKKITIISNSLKYANQFEFKKRLNLITGKNNSIGKSTLSKLLLWSIGCEPDFDTTWKSLDCRCIVEFDVGNTTYISYRYKNTIIFGDSSNFQSLKKFNKITGEFSHLFSSVINFNCKLPNRKFEIGNEIPPPAYYFLPFYIDQKRSWLKPWDSFNNLGQYSRWKDTIVKYHTGYLDDQHFELEDEIYNIGLEKNEISNEITKTENVIDFLTKNNSTITIDQESFIKATDEIKLKLSTLLEQKDQYLTILNENYNLRHQLTSKIKIIDSAINEIEKDYMFSVECIEGDQIFCPTCGTQHSNTILDRTAFLADKNELELQRNSTISELESLNNIIFELNKSSFKIQNDIAEINDKYTRKDDESDDEADNNSILAYEHLAFSSTTKQLNTLKSKHQLKLVTKEEKIKEIKKQQAKLLPKKAKEELDEYFINSLIRLISRLKADGVNISDVKRPTDFTRIFKSGGAAESTRAVLAYQLTVINMIERNKKESLAPLIIDTPNQHEQSLENYENILDVIQNDTHENQQVILCALDDPRLSNFKIGAHIIELNNEKLLSSDSYDRLTRENEHILSMIGEL